MTREVEEAEDKPQHHVVPRVAKRVIPHPSEVPAGRHDDVIRHVLEQSINGHYGVEEGTVTVQPLSAGRDQVTFVRTHDPKVPSAPHGIF